MHEISIKEEGYLGVAETVAELDQRGAAIVEYPATLEVRVLGYSKMKTFAAPSAATFGSSPALPAAG